MNKEDFIKHYVATRIATRGSESVLSQEHLDNTDHDRLIRATKIAHDEALVVWHNLSKKLSKSE